MNDSLGWILLHCETIRLNTHWVLVVMDYFTQQPAIFRRNRTTVGSIPTLGTISIKGCSDAALLISGIEFVFNI